MKRILLAAMTALWPCGALAAEQPAFQPAASWVRAAPTPPATPPDSGSIHVLLFDQQAHFGPDGVSIYTESLTRLQTPQGVAGAGSLALSWRPDVDQLVIHKLRILRGDEVIDILAKQKFAVLRRESNLEAAEIDGVLTAAIQPEDLRVGDRIDLAWTVTSKDPALAGRSEATLDVPNTLIDDLRLRAAAGPGVKLHWRASSNLDKVASAEGASGLDLGVEVKNLAPLEVPADAPVRFRLGRRIELSEFQSWSEISSLMAPLYAQAAALAPTSPLKAEAAKIRAQYKDPKDQAAAALRLVQDQVRYLALTMNDGGLVPAAADLTWSRRFGDCKGKTVLLIALLHELGVRAQPALVNTQIGDGLDGRLPSVQSFDHVLVLATIGGRVYWLDGARSGDWSLDQLAVPGFSWALPVQDAGATLTRLSPTPLEQPDNLQTLALDASDGVDAPAKAHAELVLRGDRAIALNAEFSELSPSQTETALKQTWRKTYDFIEPKAVSIRFDPQAIEERLIMDGTAAMDWKTLSDEARSYETDGYQLGWKPDWKREPGPNADLPVTVAFPGFGEDRETIILPRHGQGFTVEGEDEDLKVGAWALSRKSAIKDGVFTLDASARTLAPEVAAKDLPGTAKILSGLVPKGVFVRAPRGYRPTVQDLDQIATKTPADADGFVDRGLTFLHNGRPKAALADFQQSTRLNPQSTIGWADQGLADIETGEFAQARADLDRGAALKGHQDAVYQGYGVLAARQGDYAGAVTAFSRAVDIRPSDLYSLRQRAWAYSHLLQIDKALSDAAELLRQAPDDVSIHGMRVTFFFMNGDKDKALAEADAEVAAEPGNAGAHAVRADALARAGLRAEADMEWEKALKLTPGAWTYIDRADSRSWSDHTGILSDLNAALKLEPDNDRALRWRAQVEAEMGAYDQAVGHIDALIKQKPDDVDLRMVRVGIYVKAGRMKDAAADIAWARRESAGNADDLNNLCWGQATADIALTDALADCDAALKLAPKSASKLDSRAFVLSRLGRYHESIAGYDQALASDPALAMSLYGRGLAKLRDGDAKGGQADLARARAIGFKVDDVYLSYGLHP